MSSNRNSESQLEKLAREGSKAMASYEAEGRAMREKTARLKSLRLAKEAADAEAKAKKPPVVRKGKPKPLTKKTDR
jgi:hypothetical protein